MSIVGITKVEGWGDIVGSYGRIGIWFTCTETDTSVTINPRIWFGSKYSVSDTSNTLYFNNNATSATESLGAVSISTTVDTGEGWSSDNEVLLKQLTYTYDKGTSNNTINCAAKLADVDRVGGTMYASGSYTIPALEKFTITYNANGGSGAPSSQTKYYGKTLTLRSTKPTKSGYTFMGWGTSTSDTSVNYNASGSYTANASDTLYAIWRKSITLSYNANGGSGAPSSQSATVYNATTSKAFTISSTKPTKTGYTFLGWSTSSTATSASYSSGGSITLSSSDTLYAVWSENKLTVNYYSNYATYATYQGATKTVSASTNVVVHSQDFLYDNAASSGLADVQNTSYLYLARIGYTPTGKWGTSTTGGTLIDQSTTYSTGQALTQAFGKTLASANQSVNVYPQWQINSYTIKYNANADAATGSMASQTVEWNETFNLSTNAFKREGYKFIGWNVCRNKDNTWYATGQGWLTENEIATGGYEKKVYEDATELTFNNSWVKGDEYSISEYTMYAIWEISGVVYIDNGTSFEPYLAYIDDGVNWNLYLMYVDDGANWNIIS